MQFSKNKLTCIKMSWESLQISQNWTMKVSDTASAYATFIWPKCRPKWHLKSCFSVCLPRKEVIQPHLPIRLPCYDFTPIIGPTLDSWLLKGYLTGFGCYQLSWCDGRCVQGPGTYSPQYADLRLLAIPTSCRRVAACNPNWGRVSGICSTSRFRCPLLPTIVVRV